MIVHLRNAPEVKRVIQAAFPEYRKLKAYLSAFPEGGKQINSYWDGGSRSYYKLVHIPTLQSYFAGPLTSHPYFDIERHGMALKQDDYVTVDHVGNVTLKTLPESWALVESGIFCGKPATAHVYLNLANLTKLLGGQS